MSNSGKTGCFIGFLLVVLGALLFVFHGSLHGVMPSIGGGTASGGGQNGGVSGNGSGITLTVQTSGTYADALQGWANAYEQANPGVTITLLPNRESRDTMQLILAAYQSQSWSGIPDIWLSSTEPLMASLARHTGGESLTAQPLVAMADATSYFEWPQQPMVVLARGGRDLSFLTNYDDPLNHLPAGQYRFSYPDPLTSSGGHSAIGYCDWSFKRQHAYGSFPSYLEHLGSTGYQPTTDGSGVVAADFENSGLDFIFIHNALADREIGKHSDLQKIALRRTVYETPVVAALKTPLTRDNQRGAAANAFIQYLRQNATLSSTTSGPGIDLPTALDDQERTWEQVFNHGARLGNLHN
jgi:hypothetical protein